MRFIIQDDNGNTVGSYVMGQFFPAPGLDIDKLVATLEALKFQVLSPQARVTWGTAWMSGNMGPP